MKVDKEVVVVVVVVVVVGEVLVFCREIKNKIVVWSGFL